MRVLRALDRNEQKGSTTLTEHVPVIGWELHYTDTGSDKFYRIMVAGRQPLFQYGRTGTTGAISIRPEAADPDAALRAALVQTRSKASKGYQLTIGVTSFMVPQDTLDGLGGKPYEQATLARIFADAARAAGSELSAPVPVALPTLEVAAATALATAVSERASVPEPTATRRSRRAHLPKVGLCTRPNGEVYHPRLLGGHEDVALLRAAQSRNEHVVLAGPPGTGKSALIEAAFPDAEQLVGTADTVVADLVGTFVQDPATGGFVWAAGPLLRSVERDVPFFVDEIALIDSRVLSVLYPLMATRDVLRVDANPAMPPVEVGPNWFVVAAYNPDVPGAVISDALLDRFEHHIEVGTDFDLSAALGVSADMVTVAKNLDLRRKARELAWSPQLRTLLTFARQEKVYGTEYALAALLSKAPLNDREDISEAIALKFGRVTALSLGKRAAI